MTFLKNTMNRLRAWWGARRMRTKALIIIAIIVALFVVFGGKKAAPVIETAARQDLAQTVAATGTVVSSTDLDLSFQESNTVKSVSATVGQKVLAGQVLATLSNASEAAAVASARGALLGAQARYQKVLAGESAEEIRLAQVKVDNARRALYSEDLIADPYDESQTSVPPVISGTYRADVAGEYRITFENNTTADFGYTGLEKGEGTADDLPHPLGTRGLLIAFTGPDYSLSDRWTVQIPNTSGAHYTANLGEYESAQASLAVAKASARTADVDAALADVVSAEGSLASAQAQFEKTVIRAPSSGTVTRVDISIGDLAEAYNAVIAVQDVENLYLEANVNESGIAGLSLGQPVTVTYDALGKDRPFSASISSIDLSPTVVDGIVNYKIKALITDVASIKPGMTANLSIQTAFIPQVLVIPERTITETGGVQTVEVVVDERKMKTEKRTITTGLRGDGGLIEVATGLSEGDKVLFESK